MRKLFVCLIVGSIAAVCPALVVNETFDGASNPEGWTTQIGTGADTQSIFEYPTGGGYLIARTARSDNDNSASYCKTSLGDDAIPTYVEDPTPWNEMPEIWMSTDVKWLNSTATADPGTMVGLFNDDGDNDKDPGFNFLGACILKGSSTTRQLQVYLRANRGNAGTSTVTGQVLIATGAVGDTYRISMHFYQSTTAEEYLGDITLTDLTNPEIPVLSQTGVVIIHSDAWYFERGLDSFGVHNPLGTDIAVNAYAFDNMYLNIPEPATIVVLSIGGLIALRRRK